MSAQLHSLNTDTYQHHYCDEGSVIRLWMRHKPFTGPEWVMRLRGKGLALSPRAESLLVAKNFTPLQHGTSEVVLIKGRELCARTITSSIIDTHALLALYKEPELAIACLLLEVFSLYELSTMNFAYIVPMHPTVLDMDGTPSTLSINLTSTQYHLDAVDASPEKEWPPCGGFGYHNDGYLK